MFSNIKIATEVWNDFCQLPTICNHLSNVDSVHIEKYGRIRVFCNFSSNGLLYDAIMDSDKLESRKKMWETTYPEIQFKLNDVQLEIVFY